MQPDEIATLQPGLVSVVIPCYNAERFLGETLRSVFAQSYQQVEIIVIDDGSTDGTVDLIRSFGERVRAECGPNRGASAARNRGTELASGEFIQYLDADDLLSPDAIARRVDALRATNSDVAYSDWEKLVEVASGTFQTAEQVARRVEELDADLAVAQLKFWAPPAALMYRHTMVKRIGGWKEWLPIIQDARFLQDSFLLGGQFVHVSGIGAYYRVPLGGSLSRRSAAAFVSDVYRNCCDLHSIMETKGPLTGDMRRHFVDLYDYSARMSFLYDRAAFRDSVSRLYVLEPGFQFTWPKVASAVSSIVGFHVAGVVMLLLRSVKKPLAQSRIRSISAKSIK